MNPPFEVGVRQGGWTTIAGWPRGNGLEDVPFIVLINGGSMMAIALTGLI